MTAMDAVANYGAAMATGDLEGVRAVLAEDAVWHQPGANVLSGDHVGPDAILAHLGRFMELSGAPSPSRPTTSPRRGTWLSRPSGSAPSARAWSPSISTALTSSMWRTA